MGCSALSLMSRPSHRTTGNYSAADGQPGANYHCKGQGYGTGIPRAVLFGNVRYAINAGSHFRKIGNPKTCAECPGGFRHPKVLKVGDMRFDS